MPVVFTGPLGPITSRAYRLIESFFRCMMRPNAIQIAAYRILLFASLDDLSFELHLINCFPDLFPASFGFFSGHSESFLEPPAGPVVFFIQKDPGWHMGSRG